MSWLLKRFQKSLNIFFLPMFSLEITKMFGLKISSAENCLHYCFIAVENFETMCVLF